MSKLDPNMPILIVDDDEVDVKSVLRSFKKAAFPNPVHIANSAVAALEALSAEPLKDSKPILILLDLNMPGLKGGELLDFLSETSTFRHYKIIVHSTSSAEADMKLVEDHKLAGYIIKPFTMEKLEACLL